jgi:hypothetical protein
MSAPQLARDADEAPDPDGYVPAPSFSKSFGDAFALALQQAENTASSQPGNLIRFVFLLYNTYGFLLQKEQLLVGRKRKISRRSCSAQTWPATLTTSNCHAFVHFVIFL